MSADCLLITNQQGCAHHYYYLKIIKIKNFTKILTLVSITMLRLREGLLHISATSMPFVIPCFPYSFICILHPQIKDC